MHTELKNKIVWHHMRFGYDVNALTKMLAEENLAVVQCGWVDNCFGGFATERPEGRPDYQLLYIEKGALQIEGKRYGAKTLYLYKPGEPQHYMPLCDDTSYYYVHFCGKKAGEYIQCKAISDFTAGEPLKNFVREAVKEFGSGMPCCEETVLGKFMILLGIFVRSQKQNEIKSVEKALLHINTHYDKPLRNEEYAKMCKLNLCCFIRTFKRCTGKTPQQYRIAMLVDKAQALLQDTAMPVGQIAFMLGMEDSFYFSRIFKQRTGLSPLQYRKMHKQKNF